MVDRILNRILTAIDEAAPVFNWSAVANAQQLHNLAHRQAGQA